MNHCVNLCEVQDVVGLYCDAVATNDGGKLLFASFFGRDTAVHEFLARLTVSVASGGMDTFNVVLPAGKLPVFIGNADNLNKTTGRMPKGNLFGEMVHLWLYDNIAVEPDRANRTAVMLQMAHETSSVDDRLWSLVRNVCHLPLLDNWRDLLMQDFRQQGWIKDLRNVFGIAGISVNLGDETLEQLIRHRIQSGELKIA